MDYLYDFLGQNDDFIVAKRFMLRYYTERFTIVGQFVDRAYGGIGRRASFRY